MGRFVTRIAPTPSGYLHPGNAANFLLVRWLADAVGADVALRIDDFDVERARPEYLDDIFGVLDWLGIGWDLGPTDADDFTANYAMATQVDRLEDECDRLIATGHTFVCRCSRSDLARAGSRRCVNDCVEDDLELVTGQTALRLYVPDGTVVSVGGFEVDVAVTAGDPVMWRRDGLPAYHLASVVADRDLGVTHIVRGADLVESTALQMHLAPLLGADALLDAAWLHHALLTDAGGEKLSKSTNASGEPMARTPDMHDRIHALANELGTPIGITGNRSN